MTKHHLQGQKQRQFAGNLVGGELGIFYARVFARGDTSARQDTRKREQNFGFFLEKREERLFFEKDRLALGLGANERRGDTVGQQPHFSKRLASSKAGERTFHLEQVIPQKDVEFTRNHHVQALALLATTTDDFAQGMFLERSDFLQPRHFGFGQAGEEINLTQNVCGFCINEHSTSGSLNRVRTRGRMQLFLSRLREVAPQIFEAFRRDDLGTFVELEHLHRNISLVADFLE